MASGDVIFETTNAYVLQNNFSRSSRDSVFEAQLGAGSIVVPADTATDDWRDSSVTVNLTRADKVVSDIEYVAHPFDQTKRYNIKITEV